MSGFGDVTIESRVIRDGREIGRVTYTIPAGELRALCVGAPPPIDPVALAINPAALEAWGLRCKQAEVQSRAIADAIGLKVSQTMVAALHPSAGHDPL